MMEKAAPIEKKLAYHGVSWEDAFGYAQAVQIGRTIYVSGQLSHDETSTFIGAAPLNSNGEILDSSNMELQMRTTYENASKILAKLGATLDHVVEETVFVTDMAAAFAVSGKIRKEVYGTDRPACASTIVAISGLALPGQLVEISFTAVLPE